MSTTDFKYNAFIFNWVLDYQGQVDVLKKSLEKRENRVKIFNQLNKEELSKAIEYLLHVNFELYNYIVVVILENKSKSEHFIKTVDNQDVLIASEFLTKIQQNPTLAGIPRLFVIQKLLDIADMDDEDGENSLEIIKQLHDRKKQEQLRDIYRKRKYLGVSISVKGLEYTDRFVESPFIKIFAETFENLGENTDIGKILATVENAMQEQKYEKIDLQMKTNQQEPTFVFGNGLSRETLRDFFQVFSDN